MLEGVVGVVYVTCIVITIVYLIKTNMALKEIDRTIDRIERRIGK